MDDHGAPDPTGGDEPRPDPADDLEGYETSMSRLVSRARSWLALFVALLLVVPLGGWLLQELAFSRSADTIEEEVSAGLADSVFLVRAARCDGTSGSGSGFVAVRDGERVVVTNRHVVDGARIVGVRPLTGGPAIDVAGYRVSEEADVAVLELEEPSSLPSPLAFGASPAVGDDVRVVGFPLARPFTTEGSVTTAQPGRLVIDVRTDPGASGSPVVDDGGRVVGQIFARTGEGRGVATPVGALTDAIASARAVEPGC